MIHDSLSNWNIYFHASPWKQVYEFLSSLTPDSPVSSRIDLAGDEMYAAIMTYETCLPRDSKIETHDQHIDIQMSLINSEAIDWYPRNSLSIQSPYDPGKDRTLYDCPGQAPGRVGNFPGYFTVLFPDDAHMPKLITGSTPEMVKKVVVKLNISTLNKK
jgi:biofilm protein TabA